MATLSVTLLMAKQGVLVLLLVVRQQRRTGSVGLYGSIECHSVANRRVYDQARRTDQPSQCLVQVDMEQGMGQAAKGAGLE